MERTLVILKPDCVQRRLVSSILGRFEQRGLKLVGLKLACLTDELLSRHYADHVTKPFYPGLVQFMKSGPVVLLALEGSEAIAVVRQMMGPTNSLEAPCGTIRGDFALSKGFNLVHGSDSSEAAAKELALFFEPNELLDYSIDGQQWLIPN